MEQEKQELENQLNGILEKKEKFSDELQNFQKDFRLLADNINHHISVINDLTVSQNRILKKIHQLESSNINSEISNSLKTGFINKIKSIFNSNIKVKSKDDAPKDIEQPPKEIKVEEIKVKNNKEKTKPKELDPSLEKLLTDEIMNEEWPILDELEKTRFALNNNVKGGKTSKAKANSNVTKKENIVISSNSDTKTKSAKKTNKKIIIKKQVTNEEVEKAISQVTKENEQVKIVNDNLVKNETDKILNQIEVNNTVDIKSVQDNDILEKPTSKKEGLMLWVKYENPEYSEEKITELHVKYSNFLSSKFDNLSNEYIYSIKGPSFKLALRKILSLESEN
jgi:hypothetical protein